jgi:transposase
MQEKKVWGRKRHVLVAKEGHLLAVTVTGAHCSDQQGAKRLLKTLADAFPKIQLLWGDSHYGGSMIGWIKVHL